MATTVLLSLPSHGHINPTLPLVAELARRGERVIYYATPPFRAKVEAAGATFRSYSADPTFDPSQDLGGPLGLMARSIEWSETLLPRLLPEIRADQPGYLMLDTLCVWGNLIQQVLQLPAVTLCSTFALGPKVMGELRRSDAPQPPLREFVAGLPALLQYFRVGRRINRHYGVRTPGLADFFINRQALNLVFTSRDFQPCVESFDPSYRFTGPSVAPRTESVDFPLDRLEGRPVVYISLGTIFNNVADFYRACFAAFADGPYQVVMSVGANVADSLLAEAPAGIIVRRYVPQLEILRRSALFITHGGMNSVSEALLDGVPVIVVPQVGDQYFVAQRAAALGAGVGLTPAQATPERLRALAAQVLGDGSFRAAAGRIGQSLRQAGGYQGAADEVAAFKQRAGIAA